MNGMGETVIVLLSHNVRPKVAIILLLFLPLGVAQDHSG